MIKNAQMSGEEFLKIIEKQITKEYGEVINSWYEVDNENTVYAACLQIKGKTGYVKVPIEGEVAIP